jgi:uncharacterized membrane protein YphA (DoxX/SURF4 family)
MVNMNDSMAQRDPALMPLELHSWKTAVNWLAAISISLIFLVAGIWKVTDPTGAAVRLAQAKVPESLSLAAALLLGIAETVAGVLVLVPRFRKWGAWLGGLLLLAFMVYIGIHYQALQGAECSCFPWVKRAVGPGFFVADTIMLLAAALAARWSRPPENLRGAVLVLGAVCVFAAASYGAEVMRERGVKAPETITVDGKPFSTQQGRIFIFFFDPECVHCLDAGKRMAKLHWRDTKIIGVATQQPQFAADFLHDTGLQASISPDFQLLKKTFPFGDPPAGAAIENGRQKEAVTKFEGDEPAATLKRLGFVD